MSASLETYFFVAAALFSAGVYGLLSRNNLVALFIALELILNSASLVFVALNRFVFADKAAGQVFVVFIIALAAAEVCIGLSVILLLYRNKQTIDVEKAQELKG